MDDTFKRILALARRTGDRLIVTDPDGKEAFAILSLDQYEELLGGPKDEPGLPLPPPPAPVEDVSPLVPADLVIPPPPLEPTVSTPIPAISSPSSPSDPSNLPIGIPIPLKEDPEFGEEQFYLEPVE